LFRIEELSMKIKRFFSNIYKKFINIIFSKIYGKITYTKQKTQNIKINKINSIDNINVKKYNYKYLEINNGRIFTNYVECVGIISNKFLIKEFSFQQIKGKLKKEKNQILRTGTPKIKRKFSGNMLSLTQGASGHSNYSHWLLDILPKIKIASEKIDLQEIDFFYFTKLNSFQKQTLKLLNLDYKKFVDANVNRHVQASKILAVSHPNFFHGTIVDAHSNLPEWIVFYLRETFLKKIDYKKKNYQSIYIDRSDSKEKHCKLINNDEISKYLKKKNFKILQLSKLKFIDQVRLFYNCKQVIAPHGAGLTNLIFCKKNTRVLEIFPKNHNQTRVYKKISKINNLNYTSIKCDKTTFSKKGDMLLDVKLIQKYLNTNDSNI